MASKIFTCPKTTVIRSLIFQSTIRLFTETGTTITETDDKNKKPATTAGFLLACGSEVFSSTARSSIPHMTDTFPGAAAKASVLIDGFDVPDTVRVFHNRAVA